MEPMIRVDSELASYARFCSMGPIRFADKTPRLYMPSRSSSFLAGDVKIETVMKSGNNAAPWLVRFCFTIGHGARLLALPTTTDGQLLDLDKAEEVGFFSEINPRAYDEAGYRNFVSVKNGDMLND